MSAFAAFLFLLPVPIVTDGASLQTNRPVQPNGRAASNNVPAIWQVHAQPDHELYSNGLRIESGFAAPSAGALPFQRWPLQGGQREETSSPMGIVFHTTESHALPLEEEQRSALRRIGKGVIEFVRARRAYHFVIDRFGRVWRTVPENEPANHAGHSIWGDDRYFYLNLNHSFLGVAFEGRSRDEEGRLSLTDSQLQSARLLTEMLRSRYNILDTNCVTHAQVSVNPENGVIGYHTDLSANFPFARVGLTENYQHILPAITLFGFSYDEAYIARAGEELRDGLLAAETVLRSEALRHNLSPSAYRKHLQQRFRSIDDPHRQIQFAEPLSAGTSGDNL